MRQNVINLDVNVGLTDGYSIGGGQTAERTLFISGSDISLIGNPSGSTLTISSSNSNIILVGSGSSTANFPSASNFTLAGIDIFQVWSGQQQFNALVTFNGSGTLKYLDTNQSGSKVLTCDANGVAYWATASGGGSAIPSAPDTSVQFNSAGQLSGSANFTFFVSSSLLKLNGTFIVTSSFNVSGSTNLTGSIQISGSSAILGSLTISGSTFMTGSLTMSGSIFQLGTFSASFLAGDGSSLTNIGTVSTTINQLTHSFSVGNVVGIINGGRYTQSLADGATDAEALGVVTKVVDANNFVLTTLGLATQGVPSGSPGQVVFLSDVTPGLLTLTEPTTTNHVSKPMAIILASTTSMEVLNMRGALISPSYTFAQNTIVFGQSPYTVTTLDFFIDVDASGGNTIINLPTAVGIQGRVYNIKKIDSSSNTVAVQPFGAQTIDGQTSISMSAQYTAISIHSNNSNWWIF